MFETKVYVRKREVITCKNTQLLNPSYSTVQTIPLLTIHHHIDDGLWDFLSPYYQYLLPLSHLSIRWRNYFFSLSPLYPLTHSVLRYVSSSSWQERDMSCCERRTFTFNFRANKGSVLFSFFLIPIFYYSASSSPCWVSPQRRDSTGSSAMLHYSFPFVSLCPSTRRYTQIEFVRVTLKLDGQNWKQHSQSWNLIEE